MKMLVVIAFALSFTGIYASPIGDAIKPICESGKVPGICSVVCASNGVVTVDCVGYANVEKKTPITEDTLFWIASNTKGIAGALFLTYVQEQEIDLDAPVDTYLPEWKDIKVVAHDEKGKDVLRAPAKKPTVRNLISHTAGLRFLPGGTIDCRPMRLMAHLAATTPLMHEPDTKYAYSNWGIDCAIAIVEVVSGKTWEKALQERILDPLEMKSAAFWPMEDDEAGAKLATAYAMSTNAPLMKAVKTRHMEHPYSSHSRYAEAGGGLFLSAPDYMKFLKMILDGGKTPSGKVVLSPEAIKLWCTKQTPDCEKTAYGFGMFWSEEQGCLSHGGAFNTNADVYVRKGCARVFFWQAPGGNADTRNAGGIWQKVSREFLGL